MQSSYVFRQEEKSRFNLRFGFFVAIFLCLLLFWFSEKSPYRLFSLSPEELATLEALQPEPEDLVFRFLEAPEDAIEPEPDAPKSDVNRQAKALTPDPKRDLDPKSEGNTFELEQSAPQPVAQTRPGPQPEPEPKPLDQPEPVEKETQPPPIFSKDGPKPYRKPTEAEIAETKEQVARDMRQTAPPPSFGVYRDPRTYDNPEGGGADPLGFSIDTAGHDLGPYLKLLVQMVRSNWRIPGIVGLNADGIVVVSFDLHKDGRITNTQVIRQSEHEPLDISAYNAINTIHKAPPLPKHIDEDPIPIKFAFYYNVRPPR